MEKLLKTEQDHEEFLFWIATLQSGVIPQGFHRLEEDSRGCCCLGVGVYCTVPPEKLQLTDDGRLRGALPVQQSVPKWLARINDYVYNHFGWKPSIVNDGSVSHKEIANRLMKHYKRGEL